MEGRENGKIRQSYQKCYRACLKDNFLQAFQLILVRIKGGSEVFIGGCGDVTLPIFLKLQESWSEGGHAARQMVMVYSVILFY